MKERSQLRKAGETAERLKVLANEIRQPEITPHDTQVGKREEPPANCPLTSTSTLWQEHIQMHTQAHTNYNKCNLKTRKSTEK